MATIWKGSISFGLVNVPVELKAAVREHRISFRMLHEKDNTPIKFERVRADNGKEVPWKEIAKGYELPDGDYVVLNEKDFTEAAVKQTKMLEILDFVDLDEIDPRFFETSYFLVPSKGGERAYALLREAMKKTGTLGIGKIILHRSQHLAAMRVLGNAIELVIMRFASELVDPSDYEFPSAAEARPEEVKLAVQLVENLRSQFDAEKYVDEYNANLLRIINAKAKGHKVTLNAPERAAAAPKVIDLMERLQESLAKAKRPASNGEAPPAGRRRQGTKAAATTSRSNGRRRSA